jgi:hypothetical protein
MCPATMTMGALQSCRLRVQPAPRKVVITV